MKRSRTSSILRRPALRASVVAVGALASALAVGGCNSGRSPDAGTSAGPAGSVVEHPDTGLLSQYFIVEENHRGQKATVSVQNLYWGRLVDVLDVSGVRQQIDYVVGEDVRTNSTYEVSTNPVTEKTTVTIRHAAGTPAYFDALKALDANLTPIQEKGLSASELPPFSVAPRNSAIVIVFDDLLDVRYDGGWRDSYANNLVNASSGQINRQVVKIMTDYPPTQPFEARIVADPNHGDWADFDGDQVMEYHPTRLILSMTVSVVESADSDPPLPVNTLGLPKAITTQESNLVVRIPTRVDPSVGQTQILTNPTQHPVDYNGDPKKDPDSVTRDVVRALRSGGDSDVTGDPNNGFLRDEEQPRILGNLSVQVVGTPVADPEVQGGFVIPQTVFDVPTCATAPEPGDVLVQGAVRALITSFDFQNGAIITNLRVQVITPVGGVVVPGAAQLLAPFDPLTDSPPCFLRFSPTAGTPPASDVSKTARVIVRFSEPMNPSSLAPFDTMTVTRIADDPTAFQFVVGKLVPSSDLKEFVFAPVVNFKHQAMSAETYYFNLASGADGPTDLAGNPLQFPLPQIPFKLDPTESSEENAGVVFRFNSNDELFDDDFPEVRSGQLLFNLQREVIQPRPVNRYSISADTDKPVPSVMTPFGPGVQTPLSPLGSKMQTLWRYCDLGFSATDETNINIDVEGIAWAPVGGQVVTDAYDEFGIYLGHSAWLPDEALNTMTGFPTYPASGLVKTFNNNYLVPGTDQKLVHPKDRGYVVNPADLFTAQSGKLMLPWPMNQGIAIEEFTYYTWRDTRILGKAGFATSGVPLFTEVNVLGLPMGSQGSVYAQGNIRTIGLPLLMEFRCYPDDTALGLNAFEIALAANSSSVPNFRAFSTGGFDTNNTPNPVDPDLETEAMGGFNPNSNPAGAPTLPVDNTFYHGQLELLTRVSIVHSIWLDTGYVDPIYVAPVIEPLAELQPAGTQVVLAFRGAEQITGTDTMGMPPDDITTNAANLGFYGDSLPTTGTPAFGVPVYFQNNSGWLSSITDINTAKHFQFRITFLSNPVSNKSPELSALGFAYRQQ